MAYDCELVWASRLPLAWQHLETVLNSVKNLEVDNYKKGKRKFHLNIVDLIISDQPTSTFIRRHTLTLNLKYQIRPNCFLTQPKASLTHLYKPVFDQFD